jgi:hypothetical protein
VLQLVIIEKSFCRNRASLSNKFMTGNDERTPCNPAPRECFDLRVMQETQEEDRTLQLSYRTVKRRFTEAFLPY